VHGFATGRFLTFAVSRRTGRHSVIDVAWGLGFVVVAAISAGFAAGHGSTAARALVLVLTAGWGLRLAGYIALRQRGHAEDPRYTRMLDEAQARSPGASRTSLAVRRIYLTQGVTLLFISLPVQFACYEGRGLGPPAFTGIALWCIGLFFEGVGDYQLAAFKADPAHQGRLMDRGLWRLTRHPNYFGDACVWWGLFLIAAGHWPGYLTALSPLVMNLLLARGTGKKTLEQHMGDRPGFAEYAASTSGFFPLPPAVTRAVNRRASMRD
jgi:steroid 5-alpha reductase family enzyme